MPTSSQTSTESPATGAERTFLARLLAAMPKLVNVLAVSALLDLARREGLDPEKLYRWASLVRPQEWGPPPPLASVLGRPANPAPLVSEAQLPPPLSAAVNPGRPPLAAL